MQWYALGVSSLVNDRIRFVRDSLKLNKNERVCRIRLVAWNIADQFLAVNVIFSHRHRRSVFNRKNVVAMLIRLC